MQKLATEKEPYLPKLETLRQEKIEGKRRTKGFQRCMYLATKKGRGSVWWRLVSIRPQTNGGAAGWRIGSVDHLSRVVKVTVTIRAAAHLRWADPDRFVACQVSDTVSLFRCHRIGQSSANKAATKLGFCHVHGSVDEQIVPITTGGPRSCTRRKRRKKRGKWRRR